VGEEDEGCWVLWPLCMFGHNSVVVCLSEGLLGPGVVYFWYSKLLSGDEYVGEKGR
jgi:hypothetical protein